MSEVKFTEGPWKAVRNGIGEPIVVARSDASDTYEKMNENSPTVCDAWGATYSSFKGDKMSDAHLIAAAPDMYEILIQLQIGGGLGIARHRQIDKILAKYTETELITASLESRVEDGYMFIHVNLPNETLLYNHTVAKSIGKEFAWSVLKTSIVGMDGWLGINGIFDPNVGKWLYGDRFSPRVGQLDNSISTLYGQKVECLFYSPFITLDSGSINEVEIKTISGFTPRESSVSFSLTYNGESYGKEYFQMYGDKNERAKHFIVRRLGYVGDYVGFKFRAVTESRLAFGAMVMDYE